MLKKSNRLTSDFEFNVARKYGYKVSSPLFNIYYLEARNYEGPPKIGIVVANKISKRATKRNRVKRLIREAVRKVINLVPQGTWTAIFASDKSLEASYEEISTQINQSLQKILVAR